MKEELGRCLITLMIDGGDLSPCQVAPQIQPCPRGALGPPPDGTSQRGLPEDTLMEFLWSELKPSPASVCPACTHLPFFRSSSV